MRNTAFRLFRIVYKIFFALLGIAAVVNEIRMLTIQGRFIPGNFFSFFTIQSNLFAATMFIVGAVVLIRGIKSPHVDALRGAATLYMGLTGVVFAVLLAGLDPNVLTAAPIDNQIMHYVIPVVALLDWLIDRPSFYLHVRTVLLWLVYPVLYLAYTLLRGPIVGWYPYPFVDPRPSGYGPVFVTCLIITIGVVIGGFLVRLRSRFGTRSVA